MKKLLVLSAIALFGAVNAQKNTLLVGGNIGYNSTKNEVSNSTVNNFEFNPVVGYQFADNWTAGIKLSYKSGKNESVTNFMGTNYNTTDETNTFAYGVFGRYTQPLNETFSVYGDLDVMFGNSKNTISSNIPGSSSSTSEATGFGVMFTPNLFINFKNSFGLNFNIGGLGYNTAKAKGASQSINNFQFGFGQGVTVGISKNFGLK